MQAHGKGKKIPKHPQKTKGLTISSQPFVNGAVEWI
jgi:hypothetical protein